MASTCLTEWLGGPELLQAVLSRNRQCQAPFTPLIPDYTALRQDHREQEVRLGQLDKECDELRQENQELHQQLSDGRAAVSSSARVQELEAVVKELTEFGEAARAERMRCKEDLLDARLELNACKEQAEDTSAELDRSTAEVAQLASKIEALEAQLEQEVAACEVTADELQLRVAAEEVAVREAEAARSDIKMLEERMIEMAQQQADRMDQLVEESNKLEGWKRSLQAQQAALESSSRRGSLSLPCGGRVSAEDGGGEVQVPKGQIAEVKDAHKGGCSSLAFAPSGFLLASGGQDGLVRTWDPDSGAAGQTYAGHTAGVTDVAFNCDGNLLVGGGSDKSCRVWDVTSGRCKHTLQGHTDKLVAVDCHPTDPGRCATGGMDRCLKLWDITRGVIVKTILVHSSIADVCFSWDGTMLCSAHFDGTARFWDWRTAGGLAQPDGHVQGLHTQPMTCVRAMTSSNVVLTAGRDSCIKQVGLSGFEVKRAIRGPLRRNAPAAVTAITVSRDDRFIAGGTAAGTVAVWDAQTCAAVKEFAVHEAGVQAVAWNPAGRTLVSGDKNGTILIWG